MNDCTTCNTCQYFNRNRNHCTAWLPPEEDLMAVKAVDENTPACDQFEQQSEGGV